VKRLLLPLALCIVLAGCAGEERKDRGKEQAGLGTAQLATNDRAGEGVDLERKKREDGFITGIPDLEAFDPTPPAGLGTAQANCSGTRVIPRLGNVRYIRTATLCLLNAERRARGLRALRHNADLASAALVHARDMVRRKYFSHTSPSGRTFVSRIRATGYLSGVSRWTVGENLAWGSGTRATAAAIVRAWMGSPGHRANILNASFREIGIGIALGAPRRGYSPAATYGNEFGRRS
jgi:uncharacterized protein YkwD